MRYEINENHLRWEDYLDYSFKKLKYNKYNKFIYL